MSKSSGRAERKDPLLASLREEIGTPSPVHPVHPGRSLSWGVIVFAVVMAWVLFSFLGLRSDRALLGDPWMWGLTAIQLLVTVPLWRAAVQETLPSRRPGLATLLVASVGALVVHWVVAFLTHRHSPTPVPHEIALQTGITCLLLELLLGVPLVVAVFIFLRRYLATEPWRFSLAAGVASGVLGDGLWRLFCPFSDATHILKFHTPSVVLVALSGLSLVALGLSRR